MLALLLLLLQDGLVTVADNAALPHMAADAEGGVYVVFFRNGNVEIAVSSDKGKTFAPPVTAIDAGKKAGPVQQRGPRVAVDKNRRVTVIAPLALDPKNPAQVDLYAAASADRGQTFSKPARVNEGPVAEPLLAAVAGSGEVIVAWLETGKKGQDLVYLRMDPTKKGAKPVRLAQNVCERCAPGLAVDAKGSPSFVYREGGDAKKIRQIEYLAAPSAKAVQVNTNDTGLATCPQDPPVIAVSGDGKTVAVAWMDTRNNEADQNVYIAVARDGKFGRETRVNEDARFYQGRPSIAIDAEGVAWVAWEDGREGVQKVFVSDSKTEKNVAVTGKEAKAGHPTIAIQGGWTGVAFELGPAVAFRVLSAP